MATHSTPDPQEHLISLTTAVDAETDVDQEAHPPLPTPNRRAHPRRVVAQLAWLDNVRVKYGPEVTLLDLSPGGAQVETAGYPLQPGSAIVLEIRAAGKTTTMPAQVVRCQLASLSPVPTYRGSVRFKRSFDFPEGFAAADAEIEWDPALEYERLNVMLNRLPQAGSANSLSIGALTPNGAQMLDTAFSMIEAPQNGTDWSFFGKEMGRLFNAAARSVEKATKADELVDDVIDRLRRSIPTLSVRLAIQGGSERRQDEIVSFQVPTEGGQAAARLLVEFPKECPLEEWHLQLLQASAHLIGALRTFAPVS